MAIYIWIRQIFTTSATIVAQQANRRSSLFGKITLALLFITHGRKGWEMTETNDNGVWRPGALLGTTGKWETKFEFLSCLLPFYNNTSETSRAAWTVGRVWILTRWLQKVASMQFLGDNRNWIAWPFHRCKNCKSNMFQPCQPVNETKYKKKNLSCILLYFRLIHRFARNFDNGI